jgi:hypothetical protein
MNLLRDGPFYFRVEGRRLFVRKDVGNLGRAV